MVVKTVKGMGESRKSQSSKSTVHSIKLVESGERGREKINES